MKRLRSSGIVPLALPLAVDAICRTARGPRTRFALPKHPNPIQPAKASPRGFVTVWIQCNPRCEREDTGSPKGCERLDTLDRGRSSLSSLDPSQASNWIAGDPGTYGYHGSPAYLDHGFTTLESQHFGSSFALSIQSRMHCIGLRLRSNAILSSLAFSSAVNESTIAPRAVGDSSSIALWIAIRSSSVKSGIALVSFRPPHFNGEHIVPYVLCDSIAIVGTMIEPSPPIARGVSLL